MMFERNADKIEEKFPAQSKEHQTALADKLTEDLAQMLDADNADIQEIDKCLDELDRIAPQSTPFDVEMSLKQFHERYAQMDKPVAPSFNHKVRLLRHPIRYVIAAAVAVILAGTLIAQAAGYDIWGNFFSWTKEQFKFKPSHTTSEIVSPLSLTEGSGSDYTSLQEALDSCDTDVPITAPLFPCGFQYESITVSKMSAYSKINATLSNGEAQIVVNIRVYSNMDKMSNITTEKDETPVEQFDIDGVTHYIMDNNGKTVAVWASDKIYTFISGDISTAEMKGIIVSSYNTERKESK